MASAPLSLDAALAACDPELLNLIGPTLQYLTEGLEDKETLLSCDVKPRKITLNLTRTDGVRFVITVEKRGN